MRRVALVLGLAVAALPAFLFAGSKDSPASSSCRWSVVASLGAKRDGLFDVAAGSASSVWAVGKHWLYPNFNPSFTSPVVAYWNGKRLSFPNGPGAGAVAAIGHQAWTVGWTVGQTKPRKAAPTLLWKGPKPTQVPNPSGPGSSLSGVAMISPQDVWAVGAARNYGQPIVLHWDGTSWSKVAAPAELGTGGTLSAVAAIPGTSEVWVSGVDENANGLVARWTGSDWETFAVRVAGGRSGSLAAVSSSSAWIVGSVGGSRTTDAIYRWDGSAWTRVPSPSPSATRNSLTGVAVGSDSDAWAVGTFQTGKTFHALALHWNGSKWSQVAAPGTGLTAVSMVPGTRDAWAVGADIVRYRC